MPEDVKPTVETEDKLTAELLPAEGEDGVGEKVFEVLAEIIKDKADLGLPDRWQRNYELRRNRHWRGQTKKVPLISANLIYTHHTRTVNMLTDNNPTFNISRIGKEEELAEIYKKLERASEHWWVEEEQQAVLEESVDAGEDNGVVIEKVSFNPELEAGLGEVEVEVIDPHYFGWYPVKTRNIQKAEMVIHYRPMSIREVRRRWPDHATAIVADKELIKDLGDTRREIQANTGGIIGAIRGSVVKIGTAVKTLFDKAGLTGKEEGDECLVAEAWVRDYSSVKLLTKKGEEYVDGRTGPKYPGFIRCVTVCNGGALVLSDKPNPSINPELPDDQAQQTYLYDKFPFSKTESIKDPVTPWGFSDKEQLEQMQTEVDTTLSQISLFRNRASRLKIINPKDSGVANSQFTNAPGIINPTSYLVSQGIKYMDPPTNPIDLHNVLSIYKDFFFLVAGSFELELAQAPGRDVVAYKAIAALLERATTMLKGKIRNYSKMIRERGRMYLSHVMNFYLEDRWFTYDEDGVEMSDTIKGPEVIVPAKLTVVSGSTMPVSKIQEREEALDLFQKGAIDEEALLKRIEWEDWQEVAKRIKGGKLAPFFDMLAEMGMPPEVLQLFQEMAVMTPKEFESAFKKGEIPDFPSLLNALQTGEGDAGTSPLPPTTAQMEVQKIGAEIDLIREKTETEKVKQDTEREKIKIERAESVAKIAAMQQGPDQGKPQTQGERT